MGICPSISKSSLQNSPFPAIFAPPTRIRLKIPHVLRQRHVEALGPKSRSDAKVVSQVRVVEQLATRIRHQRMQKKPNSDLFSPTERKLRGFVVDLASILRV